MMFLLAKNCYTKKRYRMAHFPDAKSTCFYTILAIFFSLIQFSQDFNIIAMTDSLATWYPLCHHNTQDIKENSQQGLELRTTHATFFLPLESGDF